MVDTANSADAQMPNRCSLPSIMPPARCPAWLLTLCSSLTVTMATEAAQIRPITATIA